MISTRRDLKNYIKADRERQPIAHPFLAALTYSESWSVRRYLTILRNYEYHLNRYNIIKEKYPWNMGGETRIPLFRFMFLFY